MSDIERRKVAEMVNALSDAVIAAWKHDEGTVTALQLKALMLKTELGIGKSL